MNKLSNKVIMSSSGHQVSEKQPGGEGTTEEERSKKTGKTKVPRNSKTGSLKM